MDFVAPAPLKKESFSSPKPKPKPKEITAEKSIEENKTDNISSIAENETNNAAIKKSLSLPAPEKKCGAGLPSCAYVEPSWAAFPNYDCSLEIIKNGTIVDDFDLRSGKKSYYIIGRVPNCDLIMEHPSISRFHAIIQHRDNGGVYLYDNGSTHGTRLNKQHVTPKTFYRIRSGYVITFGMSSRVFVLKTPEEIQNQDEEELRKLQIEKVMESVKNDNEKEKEKDDEGCSWGFDEDAVEEDEEEESKNNSDMSFLNDYEGDGGTGKERKWMKDPKKTLRSFFEHENLEIEYDFENGGTRRDKTFICKIKLPITNDDGQKIIAVGEAKKKKDAVFNCSVDACRKLERYDMFDYGRKSDDKKTKSSSKYEDSDEDDYLDRTGQAEKKRKKREEREKKNNEINTFESLQNKLLQFQSEIADLQQQLDLLPEKIVSKSNEEEDELDSYMFKIKNSVNDKKRKELLKKINEKKKESEEAEGLIKLTMPSVMVVGNNSNNNNKTETKQEVGPSPIPITPKEKQNIDNRADINVEKRHTETQIEPSLKRIKVDEDGNSNSNINVIENNNNDNDNDNDDNNRIKEEQIKTNKQKVSNQQKKEKEKEGIRKQREKERRTNSSLGSTLMRIKDEDENIDVWVAPKGQSGDGRTSLNDKFGY